jgi:hypothetical protein
VHQKDLAFLELGESHNLLRVSQADFERVIDIFEKIVYCD